MIEHCLYLGVVRFLLNLLGSLLVIPGHLELLLLYGHLTLQLLVVLYLLEIGSLKILVEVTQLLTGLS